MIKTSSILKCTVGFYDGAEVLIIDWWSCPTSQSRGVAKRPLKDQSRGVAKRPLTAIAQILQRETRKAGRSQEDAGRSLNGCRLQTCPWNTWLEQWPRETRQDPDGEENWEKGEGEEPRARNE